MVAPIAEARFGILDEFTILEVSPFTSAIYHPLIFPLFITPNIHTYGSGVILSGNLDMPS